MLLLRSPDIFVKGRKHPVICPSQIPEHVKGGGCLGVWVRVCRYGSAGVWVRVPGCLGAGVRVPECLCGCGSACVGV